MSPELKIKIKTLASEATYIRTEERKALKSSRWCKEHQQAKESETQAGLRERLHRHRVATVRPEARHSLLAYGFLRGRAYEKMESSVRKGNKPDFPRIGRMLKRVCDADKDTMAEFKAWCPAEA